MSFVAFWQQRINSVATGKFIIGEKVRKVNKVFLNQKIFAEGGKKHK